jgi:hypothetical protein
MVWLAVLGTLSAFKLRRRDPYQDDFTTPGISPRKASPRKHRRHTPNLRRNARGRPHSLQRLCLREENFGFLASLTRFAVVDILANPRILLCSLCFRGA